MPESFALVRVLTNLFRALRSQLFKPLGWLAADAAQQAVKVNQALALELLVVACLIAFFLLVRLTLSVEKPNPAQQIAEMVNQLGSDLGEQIIGHGYERFQAFYTRIFLFVLINNLLGLIPGIAPPTSSPWVPLGLAVPTFSLLQLPGLPRAWLHWLY